MRTPPPAESAFREQIRRLEPTNDKAARLDALRWLNVYRWAPGAEVSVLALERCIRHDPEPEVRWEAVVTLALVARASKKPCPLAIVEALLDPQEEVRGRVTAYAPLFKTFEPGAAAVLLRGTRSQDPNVRADSLLLLARAAPRDPEARAAMDRARNDPTFLVRHTAHIARFTATGKLDEYVRYIIHVREEPDAALRPVPKDAEQRRREQCMRNLFHIGSSVRLIEWGEERADDLAETLRKLLDDESPVIRRGAANLIGVVAVKPDLPAQQGGVSVEILPYIEPKPPKPGAAADKRLLKTRAGERLEKLGVEKRLRRLGEEDPDRGVREAARTALQRLAAVPQKQP